MNLSDVSQRYTSTNGDFQAHGSNEMTHSLISRATRTTVPDDLANASSVEERVQRKELESKMLAGYQTAGTESHSRRILNRVLFVALTEFSLETNDWINWTSCRKAACL